MASGRPSGSARRLTSGGRSCETPMKYCYYCNRMTTGEPVFCNFCGRSYNVKLCPRLHVNSRISEVCSQCGSRDLSTPQPKVPLKARILVFLLMTLVGSALLFFTLF